MFLESQLLEFNNVSLCISVYGNIHVITLKLSIIHEAYENKNLMKRALKRKNIHVRLNSSIVAMIAYGENQNLIKEEREKYIPGISRVLEKLPFGREDDQSDFRIA